MLARVIRAEDALVPACAILAAGGVVAMPTETVYGLAGDATNGDAVLRIFEAKGRPRFNPLIAHVASLEMAHGLARFDALSLKLAGRFWPGPLTLVLPLGEGSPIHPLVTAGLDTVALRAPRGFLNPGSRDHQAWLHSEGIDATGYVTAPVLARRTGDCAAGADPLREALAERIVEASA